MAATTVRKRHIERPKARQLSLFPEIICSAYLVATESPKSAFYRIWIEVNAGVYFVVKESGTKDYVLDKRAWSFDNEEAAKVFYDRRIKDKTNHHRKRVRKYTLVYRV